MANSTSVLRRSLRPVWNGLKTVAPGIYYHLRFAQAARKMGDASTVQKKCFSDLLTTAASEGKKCLQIGVKEHVGSKYGDNWVAVDLFDTREFIDFNYDIHDLKFDEATFDVAVCISILEHVPRPEQAIAELSRVLKPGGLIWIQLPFHYPYHESPRDFWRASPDGLRVWMSEFEEISCGSALWTRTSLATSSFFFGRKTM